MEYLWANHVDQPLEINPERIVHLAKATKSQQLAILLLENQRYLSPNATGISIIDITNLFTFSFGSEIFFWD